MNGPPKQLGQRWEELCGGTLELEPLPAAGGDLLARVQTYLAGVPRGPGDFVTVVLPELVENPSLLGYVLKRRDIVRLKAGLLRERRIAVTDVPVVATGNGAPSGLALAPLRTVALVFASGIHDATIRAFNYARSLGAMETRAVYFALDHEEIERITEDWIDRRPGIRLDIVDAPFRDPTGPMLAEVRRDSSRPDTVVSLVIPELIPSKRTHYLLHRQTALFVKRLFLFEPRVVLTAIPYHLE